jgi:hypothetical protein
VDVNAEMKWAKEKAEKRRLWEENFARKKEEERMRHARDELAREKKSRLDSWMENGGSPEDFERAWPSMMRAVMEEKYRARLGRVDDIFG